LLAVGQQYPRGRHQAGNSFGIPKYPLKNPQAEVHEMSPGEGISALYVDQDGDARSNAQI
jgi:hypothetical protein